MLLNVIVAIRCPRQSVDRAFPPIPGSTPRGMNRLTIPVLQIPANVITVHRCFVLSR